MALPAVTVRTPSLTPVVIVSEPSVFFRNVAIPSGSPGLGAFTTQVNDAGVSPVRELASARAFASCLR